ncbi:hypothetical protein LOTGIDRAFT_164992, partial [Lottia gigantea]
MPRNGKNARGSADGKQPNKQSAKQSGNGKTSDLFSTDSNGDEQKKQPLANQTNQTKPNDNIKTSCNNKTPDDEKTRGVAKTEDNSQDSSANPQTHENAHATTEVETQPSSKKFAATRQEICNQADLTVKDNEKASSHKRPRQADVN